MTDAQHPVAGSKRHLLPSSLLHDLRTPLSQIIGFSEMITEQLEEAGHEAFIPDLQKVRAAGYRLLALMNDNFHPVGPLDTPVAITPPRGEPTTRIPDSAGGAFPKHSATLQPTSAEAQAYLLVVDDIENNRAILSQRLTSQGYAVATAENGREALQILRANTFDLILLDIMMPEMDGYETLQHLKADDALKHIPVIVVSALDDMDSVVRCIQLGAEDYLSKPFNLVLLKARVGACLEKKRARDREILLFEQLQQNYKRLQELERLRDDLTHMIVHDMRTPLTSVITGIQTLDVMGGLNENQRKMMDIAINGGETLLGMINDLLDVEKLESGTMSLDHDIVSPVELVSSAIGQVASLAERKKLTLHRQIAADLPPLLGDEGKLRRTLVNLLGNAIKFTPSGGTVTIEARHNVNEQSLVFCVSDTGEGVPLEDFGRIFEKFGQVESRQGGRTMSTGLGLTFCRLAVQAHGGQISVISELREGSTFCFTIPLRTR